MDRGAWWDTVHRVAESYTTKMTLHAQIIYIYIYIYIYIAYFMSGNMLDTRNTKLSLCFHLLRIMA